MLRCLNEIFHCSTVVEISCSQLKCGFITVFYCWVFLKLFFTLCAFIHDLPASVSRLIKHYLLTYLLTYSSSYRLPVLVMLTLWRPLLPDGYNYKASRARPDSGVVCIFDIRALWRSALSVRVHVKNYKWRLNPVWHGMLYIYTHPVTVAVRGLINLYYSVFTQVKTTIRNVSMWVSKVK